MKTIVKVTDITHDDLVTLMSTAMYHNEWAVIRTLSESYKGVSTENNDDRDDCLEDLWAKELLAGKALYFCDYYAEDNTEFYGEKPHVYRMDTFGEWYMQYEFTLQDIEEGLGKVLSRNDYLANYVRNITKDDGCNLDQYEADVLMQHIIFGEEIYG